MILVFIFFFQLIFIISNQIYEIYPEEQILLNQTTSDFIIFNVKVNQDIEESFSISCFENIAFRIEGPYDTIWKTTKGSVIFQKGEKANTIKKLQCFPTQNLINVTIVVVVDGNITKTETNYIQFVPKYIIKPLENNLYEKNNGSSFTLKITLYDENKKEVSIPNKTLRLKNGEKIINLIKCDKIPIASKKQTIEINCEIEESTGAGKYNLERRETGKIEDIVPLVSGEIQFNLIPREELDNGNKKHLKIFPILILLLLF